jgi:malonyl CoA-acyl carrier protein transacylase
MSSPISHPLIYLCQISNYISIIQDGLNQEKLLRYTHSATGFSTGIVAAALVSMGLSIDELWQLALRVQAMFFWQGVRCQQSMLRFGLHIKLDSDLISAAEGSPSCMASINNLDKNKLDEMIDAFSDYGIVHPSYELFPNRWIVSGLPENLAAFSHFLKDRAQEIDLKYIPSTIAAHSPFLSYALETSPLDAKRIGLGLRNNDMKIPVLANDTGSDLRDSENIILNIMHTYFTRPGIWRLQIAPLFSTANIKFVLDFGPGTGVASLTENHTLGSGIQVIRCTVPLGRRRLFTEVLPSLA